MFTVKCALCGKLLKMQFDPKGAEVTCLKCTMKDTEEIRNKTNAGKTC